MKKKRYPESARQVKALRGSKSQAVFAEELSVTQSMVSAWESGHDLPPIAVSVKLGNLAPCPACLFFWKQAGLDWEAMMAAASKEFDDRVVEGDTVLVPRFGPDGKEMARVALTRESLGHTNPLTTVCVSAGMGGLIILDTSVQGARDAGALRPLWGKIVALENQSLKDRASRRLIAAQFVGRLTLKAFHDDDAHFPTLSVHARLEMEADWLSLGSLIDLKGLEGIGREDHAGRARRAAEAVERFRASYELPGDSKILGRVLMRVEGE